MKDKEQIEVSKIEIKIGDKTIALKPSQLRELKHALNELFPEETVHEHHYHDRWWNWPIYTQPYCSTGNSTGIGNTGSITGNTCTGTATMCIALGTAA